MVIKICWSGGVIAKIKGLLVRFDPQIKNNLDSYNFISHSHHDHIRGLNIKSKNYLTFETQDILFFKGNKGYKFVNPIKYGQKTHFTDLEVIAHNAGHMLGSAQFEVRSPNASILYTGDINLRNMLTTKAADTIPCDILILETTYGHPYYVFPSLGKIYADIIDWTLNCFKENKIPVLQVYSTGKAQEVIKIFNEYTKIPVLVHNDVAQVNKAYIKYGVQLSYTNFSSKEGMETLNGKKCVLIVPTYYNLPPEKAYSIAFATGWALRFRSTRYRRAFPLSGHADFYQLISYVKKVNPKRVFTIHGFKDFFAKYLTKKLRIKAQPIMPIKHSLLTEYI